MHNEPKIPALRFPGFDGIWTEKKFGEVFSFQSTNSFSRENLNYETGVYRNIHYGDIHKKFYSLFDITKEEVPYINENIALKNVTENFLCKEGDLLFADASEDYDDIGKCIEIVNTNREQIVAGLHTIHARPESFVLVIGFSAHLFKSEKIKSQIKLFAQGIKVLSISTGRLSEIILSLPSLTEQTKIASFLTAVDDKIHQLTRNKELLEQYKKGVMQKIFSREIRFKDEEGKDFPDWEEKRLGEIAEVYTGKKDTQDKKDNGLYPFYVRSDKVEQIDTYSFDGEAILTSGDGVGVGKNFHYVNGKFDFHQRVYCICNFYYTTYGKYLFYYFSNFFYQRVNKLSAKNSVDSVRRDMIIKMVISIPKYREQQKIASYLSAIDQKINLVTVKLENMQTWKKGLLQQLFV